MSNSPTADYKLAQQVLPPPLLEALTIIFSQHQSDCMLVGGTALAGFYAGHRRSDDLDLFCKDDFSQKSTLLAVQRLRSAGAQFYDERHSAHYYRTSCSFKNHSFTIDVVQDTNIFLAGEAQRSEKNIKVATLETLLKTKCATLISRCSEKDLYDLLWLDRHFTKITTELILKDGSLIDGGMTAENLLLSLAGAKLSKQSCDFGKNITSLQIFTEITQFQSDLVQNLVFYLNQQIDPHLTKILKKLKRLSGR